MAEPTPTVIQIGPSANTVEDQKPTINQIGPSAPQEQVSDAKSAVPQPPKTDLKSSKGRGYTFIEYPTKDLGAERYPFYAIFYINVSSKSNAAKVNIDESAPLYKAGKGSAGSTVVGEGQALRNIEGFSQKTTNAAGELVGSKTLENANFSGVLGQIATRKRVKDAIALHMPNQMRVSYGANYEEVSNSGILGSALLQAANAGTMDGLKDAGSEVGKAAIRGIVTGAMAAVGFENAGAIVAKATGEVFNPRTESIFRSIGIRTHEFNYIFAPRSPQDSMNVDLIIRMFKSAMHPEIATDNNKAGNYLIMPAEFDIEFFRKDEENTSVNKINTCVLEAMSVDYSPNQIWSAFDGTSYPTHITMSLRFKELSPLTKEQIDMGY